MARKKNKFDKWDTIVIILIVSSFFVMFTNKTFNDLTVSIAESIFFASFFGYIVSKVISKA